MSQLKITNLAVAGLSLASLVGCGYDPYPTPKPVRTPGIDSPLTVGVQRATYETSLTSDAAPALQVVRPETPAIRPYEQWTEQEAAADALGRIGSAAIPHLQQALRSPDRQVKIQAADVLARMGSEARPAVSDLVALLDDPDPEVRKVATRTLGRIGPDAAAAVPALMQSLLQSEPILPPVSPTPLAEPGLLPRN